jgi:sodium/potassium-transporting ATPase subunit alpha
MCQSYGYIGWIQFWGSIFAYYTTVYDFGFLPAQLNGKASINIFTSNSSDQYNPTDPYFGNTKLIGLTSCPSGEQIDWIYTIHASQDLRMSALNCNMVNGVPTYSQKFNWGECRIQQISPFTNKPVCFST